jgi:hypothetical protein
MVEIVNRDYSAVKNIMFEPVVAETMFATPEDMRQFYQQYIEGFIQGRILADKYNMISWTNCESFDRDMPIKFLPIKWEKMRLKLEAAEKTGVAKAITFEFSHFMSPHSMYSSAHGLFDRYMEYRDEVLRRNEK